MIQIEPVCSILYRSFRPDTVSIVYHSPGKRLYWNLLRYRREFVYTSRKHCKLYAVGVGLR